MVQIRSNVRSPPTNESRITVNVAGRASGMITYRSRCQNPPPSIETASVYSLGIDTMPAM